ncbi:MAG: hypothetical protein WC135_04715 [Bacteroidales bacterium]
MIASHNYIDSISFMTFHDDKSIGNPSRWIYTPPPHYYNDL